MARSDPLAPRSAPRGRRVKLSDEVKRVRPDVDDPESAISAGRVRVDGAVITKPRSNVVRGCSIVVEQQKELRGSAKLRAALDAFEIEVSGRTCLDVGASTGGFTTVLLERGARRVYAVDAGHGQLLGSLRSDPRVVGLESTNVADLTTRLVPDPIDLVTVDVSYLSLRGAVSQLDRLDLHGGCELIGLVKPMFELQRATAPTDSASLYAAIDLVRSSIEPMGWSVAGVLADGLAGANGAVEGFVFAQR